MENKLPSIVGDYQLYSVCRAHYNKSFIFDAYRMKNDLAFPEENKKFVAKIIPWDVQPREATEYEASIMCSLSESKHSIRFIDAYSLPENGVTAIIMPLCNYGDLIDYKKSRRDHLQDIDIDTTARVFHQVACGIDDIHEKGIIHCDVNPDNILINDTGKSIDAYVGDFGSSWDTTKYQFPCHPRGTPKYRAPEVINSSPQRPFGFPADIWSYGVTLFYSETNCLPFGEINGNDNKYFENIENSCLDPYAYERSERIPDLIYEIILGSLIISPNERMTIKDIKNSGLFSEYLPRTC